jgi:hypothetical protein
MALSPSACYFGNAKVLSPLHSTSSAVDDTGVEKAVQAIRSAVTPSIIRITPKKATSFAILMSSVRRSSHLAMPTVNTTAVVVNMVPPSSAQEGHAVRHETRPGDRAHEIVNEWL